MDRLTNNFLVQVLEAAPSQSEQTKMLAIALLAKPPFREASEDDIEACDIIMSAAENASKVGSAFSGALEGDVIGKG
jgi:hypothetical protein